MEKEISKAAMGSTSNRDFVGMRAAGKRHAQAIDWVLAESLSSAGDDATRVENHVRATLSLCEFASEAVSTLGCRRLTYPRVSSGLPFLPNKLRALVAKRRGGRT